MKGIQVQKGAILLWRLGPLQYGEQSAWDRAPENRGMWAFPWPYFDMFFAFHQYGYAAPKRLQVARRNDLTTRQGWPLDRRWYLRNGVALAPGEPVFFDAYGPEDESIEIDQAFWKERDAWHETVGKKILPIRKFWYRGDLYSHINRNGVVGDTGIFGAENTDWYRMDATEYAAALRKSGGNRFVEYRDRGDGKKERAVYRSSVDHMEIFLAPGQGKILGKP